MHSHTTTTAAAGRGRRTARRALVALCMASALAVFPGHAGAGELGGVTVRASVALAKAGQYRLCVGRVGDERLGKCNNSPLIHRGELTMTFSYTGANPPPVSVTLGADACAGGTGAAIAVGEGPFGGTISATVTGIDPLTAQHTATGVGPIRDPLRSPGFWAIACAV